MPRRPEETINEEIPLSPRDFFFSMTDAKGIILGGNDVFVRVSEYALGEMVGRNHNIIRHPDMPRAVFRLLWKRIQGGLPISACVKNCSKSGRYYWVVANVFPLGGRYLSVRFPMSPERKQQMGALYARMRQAEADGGMDAGEQILNQALIGMGMASYQDFECHLLLEELGALDASVAVCSPPAAERNGGCRGSLSEQQNHSVTRVAGQLSALYRGLFEKVSALRPIAAGTAEQSRFLSTLAHDIRTHAINSSVAATRLGGEGRALGAVSRALAQLIAEGERDIANGQANAEACLERLRSATLSVCRVRTLVEMLPDFARQCVEAGSSGGSGVPPEDSPSSSPAARAAADSYAVRANLESLWDLLGSFARTVERELTALQRAFETHGRVLRVIERLNQSLGLVRIAGSTELPRISQASDFEAVFSRLGEAVTQTASTLDGFENNREAALRVIREGSRILGDISTCEQTLEKVLLADSGRDLPEPGGAHSLKKQTTTSPGTA